MGSPTEHIVIAIDGPAASGKSTVAGELAKRLGFLYVNTGAMYRAVTWYVLEKGIQPADSGAVIRLLDGMDLQCQTEGAVSTLTLDGVDPSPHLGDEAVNQNVSAVAGIPEVRRLLVDRQRLFKMEADLVMEGRDIGSVVFPETPYKFYIDASPEVRAARRAGQGLKDEISLRDKVDSSRQASPLMVASGAEVVDSSHLSIDEVVSEVMTRLRDKGLSGNMP